MTGWPRITVDELADRVDYGLTASATWDKSGPQFLRITDIQDGGVNWRTVPHCSCSPHDLPRYCLQEGDIVFARTGATTGKSYLIRTCPPGTVFASYLIRIRPSTKVDPRYLAYFFDTPDYWGQVALRAQGAGQPGINASKLKEISLPLPPLPEQRRIAAILDQADAVRRKRRQAAEASGELIPAIFGDRFGDNPADRGYSVVQLGDCADIVSGVTKGRRFNGQPTLMLPYIRVANVQDGRLDLSEVKTVEALPSDLEKYRLQVGDVLLTEGGDYDKLGRGALWEGQVDDCIHQNHIFRVRADWAKLLPIFFANYLQTAFAKAYFLRCAKKTTNLATINMRQLRALPVPLPPLSEQQDFQEEVAVVRDLDGKCAAAFDQSDGLFAALVQRAFRGEL